MTSLCAGVAAGALSVGSAYAQSSTAAQDQARPGSAANELKEVVVTARRHAEQLSRTPIAVSALSGDQLKSAGVTSMSELQDVVPGLVVGRDEFGINLNIRGITTTDTTTKAEPGISFNTDGIPVSRPQEQGLSFFDVQRVEVLRGPQGTLYGKSSTGGAVNVITNKPTNDFEGSADVELGNYDTKRADLVLNAPVNDKIAVRAAVAYNDRAGFLDLQGYPNHVDDENNIYGRLSVLTKFSDDVKLLVTVTGGKLMGRGYEYAGTPVNVNYAADPTVGVYDVTGSVRGFGNAYAPYQHDKFVSGNYQLDARLGPVHMTYLGSYDTYLTHDEEDNVGDPNAAYAGPPQYFTPTYGTLRYNSTFNTAYQELRLSNETDGPLQYVAGVNWYFEHIHESGHQLAAATSAPDPYAASVNALDFLNSTNHQSFSVYGQATYALTEKLRLTAGVRMAWDSVKRIGTFAGGPYDADGNPWPNSSGTPCTGLQDCIGAPNNASERSSKPTYRLGLDYRLTPSQMVYASIATGYKAGGFNDYNPAVNGPSPYAPESLTAYEAGYKGRIGSKLQIESTLFYYDYSQEQITQNIVLFNDPADQIVFTRMIPTTIYGWENSARYLVTQNTIVGLSANFEHSQYGHFITGQNLDVNWTGRSLDKTPAAVVTPTFTQYWNVGNGGSLKFHADMKYSTPYYLGDLFDGIMYRQKAYTRSDADLTYTAPNGRYYVQAYVKNIENKVQLITDPSAFVSGINDSATAEVSEPRFWGVRSGVKF